MRTPASWQSSCSWRTVVSLQSQSGPRTCTTRLSTVPVALRVETDCQASRSSSRRRRNCFAKDRGFFGVFSLHADDGSSCHDLLLCACRNATPTAVFTAVGDRLESRSLSAYSFGTGDVPVGGMLGVASAGFFGVLDLLVELLGLRPHGEGPVALQNVVQDFLGLPLLLRW